MGLANLGTYSDLNYLMTKVCALQPQLSDDRGNASHPTLSNDMPDASMFTMSTGMLLIAWAKKRLLLYVLRVKCVFCYSITKGIFLRCFESRMGKEKNKQKDGGGPDLRRHSDEPNLLRVPPLRLKLGCLVSH